MKPPLQCSGPPPSKLHCICSSSADAVQSGGRPCLLACSQLHMHGLDTTASTNLDVVQGPALEVPVWVPEPDGVRINAHDVVAHPASSCKELPTLKPNAIAVVLVACPGGNHALRQKRQEYLRKTVLVLI